jgi:NADH:ubiquinone oxidoreductase subunit B-like Fe-S oxidoreductase
MNKCQSLVGYCCWSCFFRWSFDTYSVLQGIDKVTQMFTFRIPPEQIVDGVMKLQELVRTESVRRRSSPIPRIISLL